MGGSMDKRLNITLAAAGAVLLTACGRSNDDWNGNQLAQQDTVICTDRDGNRVPDSECEHRGTGGVSPFLWYYLGRSASLPYYGEHVRGGSFTRTANATYFHAPASTSMTRSAAISRGGLGSSARSFGGSHGGFGE